jgi:hypothetical protein
MVITFHTTETNQVFGHFRKAFQFISISHQFWDKKYDESDKTFVK